ncbi:hypothetical protein Vretimale_7528 [Volvox reticuliferus]|uniref:acylaminoacyl-peptidase n=1 Tax=Volvox reticuliferus TaxID=1737510 RepID=A0A8J4C9I4_9CHLO|nr:hypothetical protein Vretifemale_7587 [Volvox reticuliferus]GIM02691.1 hypothetical protein Vretimale_7528 [Volvox reticuliferus]
MTLISPTLRNVCNKSLRRLPSLRICGHLSHASAAASHHRFTKPILIAGAPKATCTLCSERFTPSIPRYRNPRRPAAIAMTTTVIAATAINAGTDADVDTITAALTAGSGDTASLSASASKGLPAEVPPGMSEEAALLSAFSEVPAVSRVFVRAAAAPGAPVTVTATLQQRNLPGNSQRRYNITAALPAASRTTGETGPVHALVGLPQELHADIQIVSVSPSGRQQLVVLKGPNDSTSALLQIWRGARMIMELAVPKTLHGPLVNDGYFASGAAWTADESAVAYTAETPAPERTPAWSGPESLKDAAGPRSWRGVGAAVEDWGELNTGKRPPAPYILDLERREVLKVPGLPAENSVGQPTWCPPQSASSATDTTTTSTTTGGGPNGLLVVAWPHSAPPSFPRLAASINPRKLGVVFCYNRSARLYHVSVRRGADGTLQFGSSASRLAPSLESCLSPTFSPGGEALLFVSHSEAVATGTHGGTARLYRLDWFPEDDLPLARLEADPQLLVDVVERPTGHSAFPGLYTANIPDDGFVGPSTLLVNTQWGAVSAIAAVDTSPGGESRAPAALTPVEPGATLYGNWSLVGVAGGLVLASRVAPDTPAELYVAEVPADPSSLVAGTSSLTWRPLELGCPPAYGIGGGGGGLRGELPAVVRDALDKLEFRVLRVPPRTGDTSTPFDCLVWMPKDRTGPLPAVLSPHGGPHTAVTFGWYPSFAALTALGYAVLCPNFRGSTGYGQAALSSLPGRIGQQDVDDCIAALEAAVEAGIVDPARVSVVGGSHGGFLTAHLLGQHPRAFRCGVMRNPVTNISAMVAATDIPDWCYVEVLGSEEGRRRASVVPNPADLAAMFAASPVSYVDAVTAPVFLMLGSRDRRVPLLDGLQYLAALRGRDATAVGPPPPSRLIVFPEDGHGLDKPQTEFEQWINVMWWLKTYAGPTDTKSDFLPSQTPAVVTDAAAEATLAE